MSALFLQPQSVSVSFASQASSGLAPAANLLREPAGMVWRSADLSTPFVTVALGGLTIDTIAVVGTNLRAGDQVRVRGAGSSSMTNAILDRTVTVGAPGKNGNLVLLQLETTTTPAYVRLDFTSTGNAAGYVEAQRLVIGRRLVTRGVDIGAERGVQDMSTSEEVLGATVVDPLRRRDTWKVTCSMVGAADYWTYFDPFFSAVGNDLPFLFAPDMASAYIQNQACYGRVSSSAKAKVVSSDMIAFEVNLLQV